MMEITNLHHVACIQISYFRFLFQHLHNNTSSNHYSYYKLAAWTFLAPQFFFGLPGILLPTGVWCNTCLRTCFSHLRLLGFIWIFFLPLISLPTPCKVIQWWGCHVRSTWQALGTLQKPAPETFLFSPLLGNLPHTPLRPLTLSPVTLGRDLVTECYIQRQIDLHFFRRFLQFLLPHFLICSWWNFGLGPEMVVLSVNRILLNFIVIIFIIFCTLCCYDKTHDP